jgi:hypothetical protein
MRDWILGGAILASALVVAFGLIKAPDRARYMAAPVGDAVTVIDSYTGQLHTFMKGVDGNKHFVYVGADSRRAALERTRQPSK